MANVEKVEHLPDESRIIEGMESVDYFDSYKVRVPVQASIQDIVETALTLPGWIRFALWARDCIVKPLGLKTGEDAKAAGSRAIGSVLQEFENEIVMGDDDKHLYFRVSFLKQNAGQGMDVYLNTVVTFHNVWGRMYFAIVKMAHGQVVKGVLRRLNGLQNLDMEGSDGQECSER